MGKRFFLAIALAIALLAAAQNPVRAEDMPLDPDGFTVFVADQIREEMPDYRITIVGLMTLRVVPPQEDWSELYLDRVHDYCLRQPDDCARALESFIANIREAALAFKAPIDRGMLRVGVRSSETRV